MYGRGYNADSEEWNYKTEAWGRIAYSYATGLDSIFAYFEICRFIESGYKVARHHGVPYFITIFHFWIGFEDIESVKQKVMFAKRHGLAGVMVWSLDMDDVQKKFCRKPTKNLIETIQETCASEVAISSVDPPLPNEDPKLLWPYTHPFPLYKKPLHEREITNEVATALCKGKTGDVIIPYPRIDCQRYINCYYGFGKVRTCPTLMAIDPEVNHCNWQVFVPKCRAYIQ
ncbi:Chitinase-3-like protein 2 [Bulinus truncatus]|nr:Chitinase-3-like protein 2 [Bulinus truncatus]